MKEVIIKIPEYDKDGFRFEWMNDFIIHFNLSQNSAELKANKSGLLSLANHLINLAQDEVPNGYHIHLDDYGYFEDGSSELIIEKII